MQRNYLRTALAATALLAAGCGYRASAPRQAYPAPTATPFALEIAAQLNFTGVSAEDQALITDAFDAAQAYFSDTMGTKSTVYVDAGPNKLCSKPPVCYTAVTEGNRVTLDTASPGWVQSTPAERKKILAHEYFHALEDELADLDSAYYAGPNWLWEGAAEFAADKAMDALGVMNYADRRAYHARNSAGVAKTLRELESQAAMLETEYDTGYSLAWLAVEQLTRGDLRSLGAYFTDLTKDNWRGNFSAAFGIEPDAYYRMFDER